MRSLFLKEVGGVVVLAFFLLAAALPPVATPLAGMHYLLGPWNCTYDAGTVHLAYDATYAFDRDGHTLRETTSSSAGGDEELLAFDAKRGWTAIVLDDQGNATVMHAPGSDPNHIPYRSVYPDASTAVTFDRVSAVEYQLHATVQMGGKTIASVDTCKRAPR